MGIATNEEGFCQMIDTVSMVGRELLESLAFKAVDHIVEASPIWSGSYISSNDVDVSDHAGRVAEAPPVDHKEYNNPPPLDCMPDRLSDADAERLRSFVESELKLKIQRGIEQLKTGAGVVTLYNNTRYASDVEYGQAVNICKYGTNHPVPEYMVYNRAYNDLITFAHDEVRKALLKASMQRSRSTVKIRMTPKSGAIK